MEARFGFDFARVRVHRGEQAERSTDAVGARAYTVGSHIVFARGEYAPRTSAGTHLLLHELAHVVQQGADAPATPTARSMSRPSDASEREADAVAAHLARGGTAPPITSTLRPILARFDIPGWDCPRRLAPIASARAQASGLPGIHNGPADAYRHCWWSCEIVKQCSQFSAHTAGTGHELDSLGSSESAMDLENNASGRACGDAGGTCDVCCREKLARGALNVLIQPTPDEVEDARLGVAIADLHDDDIGPAIERAQGRGDARRVNDLIDDLRRRNQDEPRFGVGLPQIIPPGAPGNAMVTPEIALAIIENMVRGHPPWRPELGVGGSAWFVTEGNPWAGVSKRHTIPVQAELVNTTGGLRFEQADLERIFFEEAARGRPVVEAQIRARFRVRSGRDAPPLLTRALQREVSGDLRGMAERMMWKRVGEQVASSAARVGVVILPGGDRATERAGGRPVFSENPGRFTLVADATRIRLRGGLRPLLDTIRAAPDATLVRELEQSAEELARTLQLAGRVRSVFRLGGKILIVVAIANDVYQIITAEDRLEQTFVSAGGWAGASAAAAAFAALWTPVDVAGPWAWALHGVGTLVSGAIGYWIGSETTRFVYRLIVRSSGQVATP